MPQSNNDQTGSATNQQSQTIEKRVAQGEDTQRASQDARLREQSYEANQSADPDRSQEKRRRMEISL